MKIRNDFVTNSSSSSFVVARKGELTEKQKDAIIKFVESFFLGRKIEPTDENIEQIEEELWRDSEKDKLHQVVKEGYDLYGGWVSFESADYDIGRIYERIWGVLSENGDGNFEVIDGDLSY